MKQEGNSPCAGQPEPMHPGSDAAAKALTRFRKEGLLWLVNTALLHPRGWALAMHFDGQDAGKPTGLVAVELGEYVRFDPGETTSAIWDYLGAEVDREARFTRPRIPEHHILDRTEEDDGWAVEHPLSCRTDGKRLLDCIIHQRLASDDPRETTIPGEYGRYVVELREPDDSNLPSWLVFTPIEEFEEGRYV